MEILLLALTIGLPLIKILLFPARAMGRGGNWTFVGAAMIVGLMMVLWFSMQSLSGTGANNGTAAANPSTAADKTDAATTKEVADLLSKFL